MLFRNEKKDYHRDIITVDYERKVFFVDERLCSAIIFRVVGQSYALGVHSFFLGGGLHSCQQQVDNQSSMLLINIEANKCLEFIQALGLPQRKFPE